MKYAILMLDINAGTSTGDMEYVITHSESAEVANEAVIKLTPTAWQIPLPIGYSFLREVSAKASHHKIKYKVGFSSDIEWTD
jgi:hypothetical protein